MVSFKAVMVLMAVMAIKHFCADFLFQTAALARGKAARHRWLAPTLLHAGGHAVLTLIIALLAFPQFWWVAVAEWVVHAGIDRGKVIAGNKAGIDMSMTAYWWLLGFDQMLHQLTNVAIVGIFLAPTAFA